MQHYDPDLNLLSFARHPELLMSYCPLVERLGFDENFMDITEMVERRLAQTTESSSFSFKGHVYSHTSKCVAVHLAYGI